MKFHKTLITKQLNFNTLLKTNNSLFFIAPYFISEDDVKGAIGHRICETVKILQQGEIDIIWYAFNDNQIKVAKEEFQVNHFSLIWHILKYRLLKKQRIILWFCYLYTDSILILIFMPILILLKIQIFTDYIDLPLIKNIEQLTHRNYYYYKLYDILNRHYNFSIFNSYNVYKYYLNHNHYIEHKCLYFPLTTSTFYKRNPRIVKTKFTLGFIGSEVAIRELLNIIDIINNIFPQQEDIPLRLVIISTIKYQNDLAKYDWIDLIPVTTYNNLHNIMSEIDLGIIPYSKRWDKILPHKFICYISHSIPVLSTNNKEISYFISKYNCVIIYNNTNELKEIIENIINNKYDLTLLSKNSYQCSVTYFNTIKYKNKLLEFITQ